MVTPGNGFSSGSGSGGKGSGSSGGKGSSSGGKKTKPTISSKLVDSSGVSSEKTKTGIPPKTTTAEIKLDESLSDAVLTKDGIIFSEDVEKKSELELSQVSALDKNKSIGNYNVSSLSYLDLVLVHCGFNGQATFVESFVAKPGPGYTPTIRIASSLQSDIDYLILDILPFASVPGSSIDEARPKFGGNYSLDPKNPFVLKIPSNFNIGFDESSLYQYFSYTPRSNNLRVNWNQLTSRGISDFNLKLNFIDKTSDTGEITSPVSVFNVTSTEIVSDYKFQSLSVGVIKSGKEENHRIIAIEPERYDFVPYLNISNPPSLLGDSNSFDRNITLKLSRNLEDTSMISGTYFTRLDIDYNTKFDSEEIIDIKDRSEILSVSRPISSKEGTLNFYTRTIYDGYVFSNEGPVFFDNIVDRRFSHNLQSTKDGYTICTINDNLSVFSNAGDNSDLNQEVEDINDIEFRREYISNELTNEEERRDIKSNYFMYINKDVASSSSRLNPIFKMSVNSKVSDDVTCSLGYKIVEDGSKTKDNFSIKLVGLTRIGDLNNPKVFAKELSVEWDESDAFPYGKYTTYGSGTGNEKDGYPLRCLCIKDLFDIIRSNLGGAINKSNLSGSVDDDFSGLFPTLSDLYPGEYKDSITPIVDFVATKEYSGHYLLPLSRLWLGNTSGNNYEAISERNIITVTNFGSSVKSDHIYCMGLEKTISLEKFTIMTPLARKLGAPGVRSSIKDYESHLYGGDFNTISSGGEGDSRFYKWNSVRDAVNILREGSQFGKITKSLSNIECDNMYGRKCPTENYARGMKREMIGLASIGVPMYYYDDSEWINGDSSWGKIPSYAISNMFIGSSSDPSDIKKFYKKAFNSTVTSLGGAGREIHIGLSDNYMFDAPGQSVESTGLVYGSYSTRNNIVDWNEDVYPHGFDDAGGRWWITYSTYSDLGHNIDEKYGKNTSNMLDPFAFGPEYQLMFEGGDSTDGRRNISYSNLFDNSCNNDEIHPNHSHIYKLINDELQDYIEDNEIDGTIGMRFRWGSLSYGNESNGAIQVIGSGEIDYSVSFLRDKSRNSEVLYIYSTQDNEKEVLLGLNGILKEIRNLFGSSLLFEPSGDFDLQEDFPIWASVFTDISYDDTFGDIISVNPYTDDTPGGADVGFLNPLDEYSVGIIDPSNEDIVSPYMGVSSNYDTSIVSGEVIYTQTVNLGIGEDSDVLYRKKSSNSSLFEFYINDNNYRTIEDLSRSINDSLLRKGVRFTNLLDYSRYYTPDKLVSTDGYANIIKISKLNSNRHGLTLYSGVSGGSLDILGEYSMTSNMSDNIFSLNVMFRRDGTLSSITPIIESNLISDKFNEDLPVGIRRKRYDKDVQGLLRSYIEKRSSQISDLVSDAKEKSRLKINVGSYSIGSDEGDSGGQGRSYAGSPDEVVLGIQIALGGFTKDGDFIVFDAPNSYFEPNYNVFFPIEFTTKNSDMVILLIRSRNDDGSYSPNNPSDYSNYRAIVSYSNGLLPESVVGTSGSQIPGANYTEYEEMFDGSIDEVSPSVLIIPTRAPVNNVLIKNDIQNIEINIKITNSPDILDDFGFLAINRNNFNFNMLTGRVSNVFGLVLDSLGAWDVLISPEAMINRQPNGSFNYLGLGYERIPIDTDEEFIGGIGIGIPDPESQEITDPYQNYALNDIFIDRNVLPVEIVDSVRLMQVPGYPKVFVMQIDPQVKAYLATIRSTDPNSNEGCYVDIPLFFVGKTTGAAGACSVRIFYDTSCVYDYNLCDFFWNLSGPPDLAGPETIENDLDISFFSYADCVDESYRDDDGNIISRNYIHCKLSNVPMLDNGNSLVLFKNLQSSSGEYGLPDYFKPSQEALNRILYVVGSGPTDAPWELNCDALTQDELDKINKPIIYTDPGDLSIYSNSLSVIMNTLEYGDNYMFIHPQFFFPEEDISNDCFEFEGVVLGVGMVFKNWRASAQYPFFTMENILGVTVAVPSNIITSFNAKLCVKYLYNESRNVR